MPSPPLARSMRVVGLHEQVEDVRQQVRVDADAFVGRRAGRASPPSAVTETRTGRSGGVNLSALDTRLPTICSRRTGSAWTQTGSAADIDRPVGVVARREARRRTTARSRPGRPAQVERDLAGHHAADVQEVVDQTRHVPHLAFDDVAGANGARLAEVGQRQHLRPRRRWRRADCAARARASPGTRPWLGSRAAPWSAC